MDTVIHGLIGAIGGIILVGLLNRKVYKMALIDITKLEAEVDDELQEETLKKAKSQLKNINRDILHAEQLVANLKRQKQDLLVSITEGTN